MKKTIIKDHIRFNLVIYKIKFFLFLHLDLRRNNSLVIIYQIKFFLFFYLDLRRNNSMVSDYL